MDKRVLVTSGNMADFPEIYEQLQTQFPAENLHSYAHFTFLLREASYRLMILEQESSHKMIGYCLSYPVVGTGLVWLDYIAICPEYQGNGYGNLLFRVMLNAYREFADGLLFMVEKVDPAHPEREIQERRVRFYQRMGAKQLQTDFQVPTPQGPFPNMNLFFMPISNQYCLSTRKQRDTLKTVYDLLFGDIDKTVRKRCEELSFPSIVDEYPATLS